MSEHTIIRGMPADEYHADPCKVPSLSSSIAHTILSKSPLHGWAQHPKLGGAKSKPKKTFDNGNLSHALLLGAGKDIAVIDAPNFRTKVARQLRDLARKSGRVPILSAEYDEAKQTADELRKRFAKYDVTLDGDREVVVLWSERADDGTIVQCRGMMDHVRLPVIDDLKSSQSAHPKACQRHADAYGYDIQHAAYTSAWSVLHPELAGRLSMRFVFFELEAPYAVTPVELSGEFRELGRRRWRRAINLWSRCLRENRWPGYVEGWTVLDAPPWALSQEMDEAFA